VKKAGELGMAVLMDNAGIVPGDCEDLFNLAAKAPKTRFIFAHMGGANFRFWNILVLARTADGFALDNVNFDISGTVLLAADSPIEKEFVWTLRNVGVDHVMLGSDYPQISLARMVEALEKLDLTNEEKTAILTGNARRILGATVVEGKSN
jgi:predicted TIM-barrel fold metal-dependent hydrolase